MKSITRNALLALSLLTVTKPARAMDTINPNPKLMVLVMLGGSMVILGGVIGGIFILHAKENRERNTIRQTKLDAYSGNIYASLELSYQHCPIPDCGDCFKEDLCANNKIFQKYLFKKENTPIHQINQIGEILRLNDTNALNSLIKFARFTPQSTNKAKSLGRIKTFLLSFNRTYKKLNYELPQGISDQILSYLPEDILHEDHFRRQIKFGGYKTLVKTCPYEWFVNLSDNLSGQDKIHFIDTITPHIVDYRLNNLKELFGTNLEGQTAHLIATHHGNVVIANLLDPEKVEQHHDMLAKHIRNELARGRRSISSDNLPAKLKNKQKELKHKSIKETIHDDNNPSHYLLTEQPSLEQPSLIEKHT